MPSRKHIKPLPRFAFVIHDFETEKVDWLKKHSDVTRSHAAYWGGPAKYQKENEEQNPGAGPNARCRGRTKSRKSKTGNLPCNLRPSVPRQVEADTLQFLPSLPADMKAISTLFNRHLSPFRFYGDNFVRQFLMSEHEDYSIMFSGCLLLSYAHHMTLTGHGTKIRLLELKDQVIRRVRTKLKTSDDPLSPQCLAAILALGNPIVCLASRDMPKSLSVKDYITASMDEDYLCCQHSADIAQDALAEEIVHRQAMFKLFSKSNNNNEDDDSLSLFQYVSRFMDILMAMETANHLNIPLDDVMHLYPPLNFCEVCSIPGDWTSPLTCRWSADTSVSYFEMQMLTLVELVHKWLATFFDGDNLRNGSTENFLEERARLRRMIERFLPIAKSANKEEEAMYECCRWASLILLTVEGLGVPIHIAAKHVQIRPKLIRRLRMTNLSNLWGKRRGLLFWVTTMCHFSTAGQCFPLLSTSLFAQFAQEIAMSPFYSEIAVRPLRKLKQFESFCGRHQPVA